MDHVNAAYIEERRASLGLTRSQLARRIGTSERTLYRYLSGDSAPSFTTGLQLTRALELNNPFQLVISYAEPATS